MKTERIIRLIIQGLSLVLIILFFIPTFCVSCSGEELMTISASTMATGVEFEGSYYGAAPQMFIFIIIPILAVILAIFRSKITSFLIALIGLVDMGGWIFVRAAVEDAVSEYGCTSSVKAAFIIDLFISLGIIALGIVCLFIKSDTQETDSKRELIKTYRDENVMKAEAEMKHWQEWVRQSEEIRERNSSGYDVVESNSEEMTLFAENGAESCDDHPTEQWPMVHTEEVPHVAVTPNVEVRPMKGSSEAKKSAAPKGFHKPTEL